MKVVIQMSRGAELKALPILYTHSPGMVLPGGKYVLSEEAVAALRAGGVQFTELTREALPPVMEGVGSGERI